MRFSRGALTALVAVVACDSRGSRPPVVGPAAPATGSGSAATSGSAPAPPPVATEAVAVLASAAGTVALDAAHGSAASPRRIIVEAGTPSVRLLERMAAAAPVKQFLVVVRTPELRAVPVTYRADDGPEITAAPEMMASVTPRAVVVWSGSGTEGTLRAPRAIIELEPAAARTAELRAVLGEIVARTGARRITVVPAGAMPVQTVAELLATLRTTADGAPLFEEVRVGHPTVERVDDRPRRPGAELATEAGRVFADLQLDAPASAAQRPPADVLHALRTELLTSMARCFRDAGPSRPLAITITLDAAGAVSKVTTDRSDDLAACVIRAGRDWQFPRSARVATYTFHARGVYVTP